MNFELQPLMSKLNQSILDDSNPQQLGPSFRECLSLAAGHALPPQLLSSTAPVSKSPPPVPTPVSIEPLEGLQEGESGPQVKRMQKLLKKWNKGLNVSVNGRFDQSTRQALTLYKAIYGTGESGAFVDQKTAKYLAQMEDGTFWQNPPVKTQAQEMLYHASRKLGTPYVLGGDGNRSTDCGQLTSLALSQSGGAKVSRLADMQYAAAQGGLHGLKFHRGQPKAGDLVFFRVPTRQSGQAFDGVTHVTMYVGDGLTLAASSGAGEVILQPLSHLERYVAGYGRTKPEPLQANNA